MQNEQFSISIKGFEDVRHQNVPSINFPRYIYSNNRLLAARRANSMFLIGRDVVTHLASLQFDSDNMTQRLVEELNGNTEVGHFVRELLVFADGRYGLRRS